MAASTSRLEFAWRYGFSKGQKLSYKISFGCDRFSQVQAAQLQSVGGSQLASVFRHSNLKLHNHANNLRNGRCFASSGSSIVVARCFTALDLEVRSLDELQEAAARGLGIAVASSFAVCALVSPTTRSLAQEKTPVSFARLQELAPLPGIGGEVQAAAACKV